MTEYSFLSHKTQRANKIVDYGIPFSFRNLFFFCFLTVWFARCMPLVSLSLSCVALWHFFFFYSALPNLKGGVAHSILRCYQIVSIKRERKKKKALFVWLVGSLCSLGWAHPRFCRWQRAAKVQHRIHIVEYKKAEILWQNKYTLLHVPLCHDVWWDGHPAAHTGQVSTTFFFLLLSCFAWTRDLVKVILFCVQGFALRVKGPLKPIGPMPGWHLMAINSFEDSEARERWLSA